MEHRVKMGTNHRLKKIIQAEENSTWKELNSQIKTQTNITEEDLVGEKPRVKTQISLKISQYFKEKLLNDGQDKSKVKYLLESKAEWRPLSKPRYMSELTRSNTSIIFQTRTRMIDVKNNFRNKYPDVICRACRTEPETQEHVLESCDVLHTSETTKVRKSEVFLEDTDALKITAKKIRDILVKLNEPQ